MTVRAGSSSACWLSISAKLSFIQILLKEGQGLKIRLIDGIADSAITYDGPEKYVWQHAPAT
jgi:hypothetical protein